MPPSDISPTSFLQHMCGNILILKFTTVEVEEVIQLIRQLQPDKATRADKIPAHFIKACPLSMGKIITSLINKSISTSTVPSIWKKAIVTPIQKSKLNDHMTNYRPISVLPVVSKLLERVIQHQIVTHLLENELLSNSQLLCSCI